MQNTKQMLTPQYSINKKALETWFKRSQEAAEKETGSLWETETSQTVLRPRIQQLRNKAN